MSSLISVVITTKNRPNLLPRSIDSVLAQTHKDLEVIIVDDGSEIPADYRGTDCRVRLIRNEKSVGPSLARNIGLRAARGDFFAILDDDDFYFPDKLERQLTFLNENPDIALVFSRVVVQDARGNRSYYLPENHVHSREVNLRSFNLIHTAAVLFRRSVFDSIQFENTLQKYVDMLFFNQVCVAFQTAYLSMDAAVWMQDGRPDQLTRVIFKRNFDNFRIVCEKLAGEIDQSRDLRRLYYGRLAWQAARCGYLIEAFKRLARCV